MFRYRQLSYNVENPQVVGGDMCWGQGQRNYLVDSPTAVAQAVLTRLKLWQGEWFLNLTAGMPWMQQVLGHPARTGIPDAAIRQCILGTPYVTEMYDYASTYEPTRRTFSVSAKLYTAFGQVTRAPAGALISPSGALVVPLSAGAVTGPVAAAAERQRELPEFMARRLLPERF